MQLFFCRSFKRNRQSGFDNSTAFQVRVESVLRVNVFVHQDFKFVIGRHMLLDFHVIPLSSNNRYPYWVDLLIVRGFGFVLVNALALLTFLAFEFVDIRI